MKSACVFLLLLGSLLLARGQSGPCTESIIKSGGMPLSDDAFSYMPAYDRPVIGHAETSAANEKSFSDSTNVHQSWEGDHRIVVSPAGDMGYEFGTLRMSYDSKSKGHQDFEAVMLMVYKAKGQACEQVALTMQPLEPATKK